MPQTVQLRLPEPFAHPLALSSQCVLWGLSYYDKSQVSGTSHSCRHHLIYNPFQILPVLRPEWISEQAV